MNDLNSFSGRNDYGEKAVEKTAEFLNYKGIKYDRVVARETWRKTDQNRNWDEMKKLRKLDLENGDLTISNENFDIKRNAISLYSLDNFKGKYFILHDHFLNEARVYDVEELRRCNRAHCEKLSSGDLGFKFHQLKNVKYKTLEEFFKI
jgi:hypothetical protein